MSKKNINCENFIGDNYYDDSYHECYYDRECYYDYKSGERESCYNYDDFNYDDFEFADYECEICRDNFDVRNCASCYEYEKFVGSGSSSSCFCGDGRGRNWSVGGGYACGLG